MARVVVRVADMAMMASKSWLGWACTWTSAQPSAGGVDESEQPMRVSSDTAVIPIPETRLRMTETPELRTKGDEKAFSLA